MDEGLSTTGRRMLGYALRWGQPARIRSAGRAFDEHFRKGAFAASIKSGQVRLCLEHEWTDVVARQDDGTLLLTEDHVGLRVEAYALHTMTGDDALYAVRCRSRAGLSVSFDSAQSEWTTVDGQPLRQVVSCRLREISVCRNPAYRSSEIVAGRMRVDRFMVDSAADNHRERMSRLAAAEAAVAGSNAR